MLFEAALLAGVLFFGAGGGSVRTAARQMGRVVGRASGSLRRVRSEVDALQARADAAGGSSLQKSRQDVASRLQKLRAIQMEAASLMSIQSAPLKVFGGGAASGAASPAFSEEEMALALQSRAAAAPAAGAQPVAGRPAQEEGASLQHTLAQQQLLQQQQQLSGTGQLPQHLQSLQREAVGEVGAEAAAASLTAPGAPLPPLPEEDIEGSIPVKPAYYLAGKPVVLADLSKPWEPWLGQMPGDTGETRRLK